MKHTPVGNKKETTIVHYSHTSVNLSRNIRRGDFAIFTLWHWYFETHETEAKEFYKGLNSIVFMSLF